MELIILIICATAYMILRTKEDYQRSRNQATRRRENLEHDFWMQRITNRSLEQELRKKFYSQKEMDAVIEEVKNNGYPLPAGTTWITPESMLRIEMAKNGYLVYNDAFANFMVSWGTLADRQILFWCDKLLRERHAPTRLVDGRAGLFKWEVLRQ